MNALLSIVSSFVSSVFFIETLVRPASPANALLPIFTVFIEAEARFQQFENALTPIESAEMSALVMLIQPLNADVSILLIPLSLTSPMPDFSKAE